MILIIDTTSSKIKLALGRDSAAAERMEFETQKQSVDLPRLVADLDLSALSAIGVVVGPGSFTGIRLGIAYSKGLAMGFGIPLIGMNVFELAIGTAISSGRGDYFISENGEYKTVKDLPNGAVIINDYDVANGIDIVHQRMKSETPVIPLYIRPSYVG